MFFLADLIWFLHVYISTWLIIMIIIITVFHLGIFKIIVTFICVCENDRMWLHQHWSQRLRGPFQPLFNKESHHLVLPKCTVKANTIWAEKKKKNRSQKLGNTQIVVIQFTAGRTQLFQQAAVITFSGVKTSLYSFAKSFDSNSSSCVHHFFASPFAGEEIILFYF